ncbi:hypothetical protein [Streptomyces brasiliensis]|uniref:Uncharacterized protein n=1 Tax=Streptomyces brasiliensis TaxID=1954 RepID=A0A917KQL4_9ACTN|nr:hypothetical protein [Streptomyces brasiliensis]GGJ21800.1 hypothetical protein GCM10010121_035980 [Streptomyces brasiliensis]
MSTYNFHGNADGSRGYGDHDGDDRVGINNGALLRVAEQLVERLRSENPALIGYAEIIRDELTQAAPDGRGANHGRIRSSLETIGVGVSAGTGSLVLVQQLTHVLGL